MRREVSNPVPSSYILAKVMFKRRVYGTHWYFSQIMEVHTSVPHEKSLAEKLQRIKPKVKVAQAVHQLPKTNRQSNASCSSHRSSKASGQATKQDDSTASIPENSIIVIECPRYVEVDFKVGAADDCDDDEMDISEILRQTEGYLTVFSVCIKPLQETGL